MALGFDKVVTGHYATVAEDSEGSPQLFRSADWAKDQSYVLGVLTEEQLRHCYFPLGDTPSKQQVREEAQARGFGVHAKPDSHDICFIPDGDTQGFLRDKIGEAPGAIVDRDGNTLGSHQGTHEYTVGQRKGLQIGYPAADGKPRYVLEVRPVSREVVVGPKEALDTIELSGDVMSFAGKDPVQSGIVSGVHSEDGSLLECDEFACEVQGRMVARFAAPLAGVAPGQSAVVYRGLRVLGQVTIDHTVSADAQQLQHA
jgi:tRNA-specific 2-thiouridylase